MGVAGGVGVVVRVWLCSGVGVGGGQFGGMGGCVSVSDESVGDGKMKRLVGNRCPRTKEAEVSA